MFVAHKRQTSAQASDSANAARLGAKIQSFPVITLEHAGGNCLASGR